MSMTNPESQEEADYYAQQAYEQEQEHHANMEGMAQADMEAEQQQKMRILIGCPINEDKLYCWEQFKKALQELYYPNKDIIIVDTSRDEGMKERIKEAGFIYEHVWAERAMDRVTLAREIIRKKAVVGDYNCALFIDADAILPPLIVEELLLHDKEIVSALLFKIGLDNLPAPVPMIFNGKTYSDMPENWIGSGLREIDFTGFGCCLIDKEVLKKVKIRCERLPDGKLFKCEDLCFSEDCKRLGIKIYCDTNRQVSHKIQGQWDFKTA